MKKQIKIGTPVNLTGYGCVGLNLAQALDSAGWKVQVQAYDSYLQTNGVSSDVLRTINKLQENVVEDDAPYLQNTLAEYYEFSEKGQRKLIGYTPFESIFLPPRWVENMNKMDEIWVPCQWNKECYEDCGVKVPIRVVPYIVDNKLYNPNVKAAMVIGLKDFNFLGMGDCTSRKGIIEYLIPAFLQEFKPDEKVGLTLKIYYGTDSQQDQMQLKQKLYKVIDRYKGRGRITFYGYFIRGDFLPSFMAAFDALVSPHAGEGWGLNISNMAALGKSIIATNATGNLQFMTEQSSYLVKTTGLVEVKGYKEVVPFVEGLYWEAIDINDLRKKMRQCYENKEERENKIAKQLKILEQFYPEKIVEIVEKVLNI